MAHITIDSTATRISYTATASQTAFTIPFEFFDEDDLKVYQNGTLKTKTTHYTVTPVTTYEGGFDGGTVTLGTGATVSDKIVIALDMAIERSTDFPTSGPFNITTLNTWIDKMFVLLKQITESTTRMVTRPTTSTETYSLNWPDGATTDPKVLVASSDAGLELGATNAEIAAAATKATEAAASAAAALVSQNAAAGSATTAAGTATTLSGASSTTSLAIGTGSKAFTVASGLAFVAGDYVIATSNSGVSNYMHGQIASYSGTTLTLTSANTGGSGTKTDWTIRRSGPLGATGATGSTGAQGNPGDDGEVSEATAVALAIALG